MFLRFVRLNNFVGNVYSFSRSISSLNNAKVYNKFGFKDIVLVEGVRTPFLLSGTNYKSLMPHNLAYFALLNLIKRVNFDKDLVDYIVFGSVIQVIVIK